MLMDQTHVDEIEDSIVGRRIAEESQKPGIPFEIGGAIATDRPSILINVQANREGGVGHPLNKESHNGQSAAADLGGVGGIRGSESSLGGESRVRVDKVERRQRLDNYNTATTTPPLAEGGECHFQCRQVVELQTQRGSKRGSKRTSKRWSRIRTCRTRTGSAEECRRTRQNVRKRNPSQNRIP